MPYKSIEHHGAKDGVTGSCHQLHIDDQQSLLIDCGLFQGAEVSGTKHEDGDPQAISFNTEGIRALIATHVHIDHVGRIPWLLDAGFKGPIICSEPSAKLLPLVLEDAFKLGISRDTRLVERYLSQLNARTIALPYKTWFTLIDDDQRRVRIKLQRAGHILGSGYVECDLLNRVSGRRRRVVFSGDLGAPYAPLLPSPRAPYRADVLVLESTYGDRLHEDRRTRVQRLRAAIERAQHNGGTLLIPAFSIGRTQEILYELEALQLVFGQEVLPVVLDSPLAARFTQAYRELKPYWDAEAHRRLTQGHKPLSFDNLLTVESHSQHEQMVAHLAKSGRPAIVIAGSGMCNAGRIVNYLKRMLDEPKHAVLFVGYQAAGTLGREIQQYGPRGGYVWLDDERIDIRAHIQTIGGYSAHADQRGLVNFVKGIRYKPQEIRLVHGNLSAKDSLKAALAPICDSGTQIFTHF
ncbi:Metallo-beta-lactamase family protein, RNA-specific [Marinobacterium lacunae]|uniref:Metallo-beta-lactamase family protein, RNA-specific n=1 Tax=Marinobacterium lacunae TaxID=1232683 RepID=A0A081G0C4_9GAMM|nr:MBL fold metallo-hydrolase [Marinobacterium lacunae]KEA64229.1 Metallo-beta-lactamase family protein, RNA-specific [Marinobacterium lacunae]